MITNKEQKYIQSLHNKKYRKEYRSFLVEGDKNVSELLLSDFEVEILLLAEGNEMQVNNNVKVQMCSKEKLSTLSTLSNNSSSIAVVKEKDAGWDGKLHDSLILVLDGISDPGNLGTIIRLADWYGFKNIFCSLDTTEFYNPKTIAATMGSFTRVMPYYIELRGFLSSLSVPILGAFLEGESIYDFKKVAQQALIIGSESHGIRSEIATLVQTKITIPRRGNAESLNAAMATAIMVDRMMGA